MTMSSNPQMVPAASGAATLWPISSDEGTTYIFGRLQDNGVYFRTTTGLDYSDWTSMGGATGAGYTLVYPAVASTSKPRSGSSGYMCVFARGGDNALYVRRTTDGVNYSEWASLGGILTSAPAAVDYEGGMQVFARGSDNALYYNFSADGINFTGWQDLGGILYAAPVAAVLPGNRLTVFARGFDQGSQRYRLYQKQYTDGVGWGNWVARGLWQPVGPPAETSGPDAGRVVDYVLATDIGVNFVSDDHWTDYYLPAFQAMKASLAKFSMFYGYDYPAPHFSAAEINAAIANGAVTVIFRTAEVQIAAGQVDQQLNLALKGGGPSILSIVQSNPGVDFWIEVGNETNLANMSPWDARYDMLTTIRDTASKYRSAYPNLRWMASMPTKEGVTDPTLKTQHPDWVGMNYLNIVLSDAGDGLGTIGSGPYQFDALGVHTYGDNTLEQSYNFGPISPTTVPDCSGSTTGDANCPNIILDRCLSKTALPIFITEAGIGAGNEAWTAKTTYYVQAMYRMPNRVRGYAVFTVSLDSAWYSDNTNYAVDVSTGGQLDTSYAGSKVIGNR